ncbi:MULTISPECIES: MAE_28990/MAE_18760 family HEPN-like nuclease [unclassified Anabaena]|uniref:MAE_28990/MAE_18760 family HEPN-like nuclease n=1 Tax=unclassified Anabaena TaxID=2619674 RepID=UPI000A50E30B|nr:MULTISPECIES: MAE_28990/MAE_18760 family HEPN-like nuclease [unclassified Anabaena]
MTVKVNIATVSSIIKTNNRLMEISFASGAVIKTETSEEADLILNNLLQDIPKAREWRIYDHCAVVTRLYAIYERFVEELISDWLILLPELYPCYSDLEETIRNTHRVGVGRLLVELNKSRYEHLTSEKVMQGLFYGNTGEKEYELLPDAFLIHEQNLRRETLERLFANAGISNAWVWVEKHRAIKHFLEEIRGNQNTAEGELNEFISYRNDAAHGVPDDVLGASALLELCDFIDALCEALAELVTYQVIKRKKLIGKIREVGTIIGWFKRANAGVAKVAEIKLSVGNQLFLVSEDTSCCYLVTIKSLHVNDNPVNDLQTTTGMEVGLKFDLNAKKGLRLYQLQME